jgi:hypothetical protein
MTLRRQLVEQQADPVRKPPIEESGMEAAHDALDLLL